MLRGKELGSNKTSLRNSTAVMNQCKRKGKASLYYSPGRKMHIQVGVELVEEGSAWDYNNGHTNER